MPFLLLNKRRSETKKVILKGFNYVKTPSYPQKLILCSKIYFLSIVKRRWSLTKRVKNDVARIIMNLNKWHILKLRFRI